MARVRLIHVASTSDANMLYATGFWVPDPFTWYQRGRTTTILVNDLEYGRACREARVDRVVTTSGLTDGRPLPVEKIIRRALGPGVREVEVPWSFPAGLAARLRRLGVRVRSVPDPFFPQRMRKSPDEVGKIRSVQRCVEEAVAVAVEILRRARVRGGVLHHRGEVLTSQRLRHILHRELLAGDCVGRQTIVAGGRQACDPHAIGSGPLRAGEAIVLDVFPRSERHGYYADMTRTVVRGRASPALVRQYRAVEAAQQRAFRLIRAGADGAAIHRQVQEELRGWGYVTERRGGRWVGFFHGTGHGVGLDIHEPPRIGLGGTALPEGAVVTVEPGLYYPGVGGVRIEDMVVVTREGCRNLTKFPKFLEL